MKTQILLLSATAAFAIINGHVIQDYDTKQRNPIPHPPGQLFERFDASKCPVCEIAEDFERNSRGDVVSCKCIPDVNNMFGGDMKLSETTREWVNTLYGRRSGAPGGLISTKKFLWPEDRSSGNVNVPFVMDSSITSDRRSTIREAIRQFNLNTCIRFIQGTRQEQAYLVLMDGGGCWSYVGKQGGSQKVSIGRTCNKVGVVEHELMHALGFFHEQSRPDRDDYISVLYQNIIKGMELNFEKMEYSDGDLGDASYDVGSVLHYGEYAFSVNQQKTILVRNKPNGVEVGQRDGFSKQDIQEINRKYCRKGSQSRRGMMARVVPKTTTTTTTARTTTTTSPITHVYVGDCKNKESDKNCDYWMGLGYCQRRFVSYVTAVCKKSCGIC